MTFVEDTIATRTGSTLRTAPAGRSQLPALRSISTPRPSASLERRRQWERRYQMRLRFTDATVILGTVGVTATLQLMTGVATGDALRNAVLLSSLEYVMLSVLHTRGAALFHASATEYRGVANTSGLIFAVFAMVSVLLGWRSLQFLLLIGLPLGTLALLVTRWL